MHSVLANYAMPAVMNAIMPAASSGQTRSTNTRANAASSTGTSSSTSSSTSAGSLGTTFLSLLAQELQNQDPTAPVDPTAMVGQMISLNQLEQLIGINQAISSAAGTTTSGATPGSRAGASNAALDLSSAGGASMLSPSAAGAATSQLPFDPSTMMPLGSGNAGALAASFNSSVNAATMGLSGTNNNTSGGK